MNNLQVYTKPKLALLEEKIKIRDYPEDKKLIYSTKIVNDLLIDFGVGNKTNEEQHKRLIKYISDDCGGFTYEEIQNAFKMVLKGVLNIDLFQQMNILVFSKVLKLYKNYKNDKLRAYRIEQQKKRHTAKPMTEDEVKDFTIKALDNQFSFFLETRNCDISRIYVYDILDKKDLMPKDLVYKNSVKKDAIEILTNEYKDKKAGSKEEFSKIKRILSDVENNIKAEIINKCKELALLDWMRKNIKTKEDFEKYYPDK